MNKVITFLFSLVLLTSCGMDYNTKDESLSVSLGETMKIVTEISEQDKSTARRICEAFRTKRNTLLGVRALKNFVFSRSGNSCIATIPLESHQAQLSFDPSQRNPIFNFSQMSSFYVETDSYGVIGNICDSVLNTQSYTPITYSTNHVEYIIFVPDSDGDMFMYQRGTKVFTETGEFKGDYKLIEKITFTVNSRDSLDKLYGFVKVKESTSTCTNKESATETLILTNAF